MLRISKQFVFNPFRLLFLSKKLNPPSFKQGEELYAFKFFVKKNNLVFVTNTLII